MIFWAIVAVLCLLALWFGAWPLYRQSRRLTPLLAGVIVFTVAFSVGLYGYVGSPELPSAGTGDADLANMDTAMASLRQRLAENPDDLNGWKMLARSEMALQQFGRAVESYERAMALEDGRNGQTLVDLALALLSRDGTAIEGRPAALLEGALALEPNNPAALFYSGIALADRGETGLAAERWEILLGLSPPPEIRATLESRIAEWRGVPMASEDVPAADGGPTEPVAESVPAPVAEPHVPAADPAAVVTARVALSANAISALTTDANVFVIARDPLQPSPPIAVTRLRLSELPAVVSLGDAQSMVAGRDLSGFEEFELLARVSLSGSPAASPGDWFGTLIVRPADGPAVFLPIDQQVP